MDRFTVEVISQTPNPQQTIYAAMHQDYAEAFVWDERDRWPNEVASGDLVIKNLLAGGRGHYGPLEHPQIVLNCGWFPHSTMQQVRTHRVGVSFDVQCLAADTEITFLNSEGETTRKLKKTIGELYALWTNGENALREREVQARTGEPPETYRDCQSQIRKMHLRVLNEDTGLFEVGQIKDVMSSGIQPVYRVTLEDGKTLDCTENHRLLTSNGWQTMADAVGLVTAQDRNVVRLTKACSVMCNGLAVVGNGLDRDRVRLQEQIAKERSTPVKVSSVQYLGLQMTYDLEVEGPWHNFVANGLVVHNSFRYTGQRIIDVAENKHDVEEVFYLRPVGFYTNRQGKHYNYTEAQRQQDLEWCLAACRRYQERIEQGLSEEHARGLIPFDVRQHWVLSANVRSLLHLLDLRWKADAQLEAQKLCELIWPHFQAWVPAVAAWYEANRLKKARLAP